MIRQQPTKRLNQYGRTPGERATEFLAGLLGGRGFKKARCLVVLSNGRVGTDTLAHVLDLSPEIRAYHEPSPQLMAERLDAYHHLDKEPERIRQVFVENRANRLASAWLGGKVYAETSARLTFFAPIIAEMLPNSKFLHLHRHPGDIVRSGMRRGWYNQHPADHARLRPAEDDPDYEAWQEWDPFTKICWYWNAFNKFAVEFGRSMPADRFIAMQSSEMFDFSRGGVAKIFELIGVPMPPEEQIREQLSARHNAQTLNDFPPFREWTAEQKQILEHHSGATMKSLGYTLPSETESTAT